MFVLLVCVCAAIRYCSYESEICVCMCAHIVFVPALRALHAHLR